MDEFENVSSAANYLQENHPNDIKIVESTPGGQIGCDYVSMEVLFPLVRTFISAMMIPNNDGNAEAQQMSKLMKTAVKGILIMYGDRLLTLMLGKDHERPPKGVDLVEWYTNTFASVALTMASKRVYVLHVSQDENDLTEISGLSTLTLSEKE